MSICPIDLRVGDRLVSVYTFTTSKRGERSNRRRHESEICRSFVICASASPAAGPALSSALKSYRGTRR